MPTYSLWFEPPPALAPKYQAHIDRLQQRVASETSFVPHVTLLGGVDGPEQRVTGAASQLAASLEPFPIRFARAARGDIFHQCVFLLAETSDELMKANVAAREALGMSPGNYMPHLSLLYADISQAERQEIVDELNASGDEAIRSSFEASALAVWETDGADKTCRSWRRVASFPLG